jgi:hypothetical protein
MPRQKSLLTVIRDLVREEVSSAFKGLLGNLGGGGKPKTRRRRRRRGPGRPPGRPPGKRGPGRPRKHPVE